MTRLPTPYRPSRAPVVLSQAGVQAAAQVAHIIEGCVTAYQARRAVEAREAGATRRTAMLLEFAHAHPEHAQAVLAVIAMATLPASEGTQP